MSEEYLAHDNHSGKVETLYEHLMKVSKTAGQYAAEFDNEKIGKQIGLLHDLGKHTYRFQNVLKGKESKIDHAIVGAIYYFGCVGIIDSKFMRRTIAGIIAAHHSLLRCKENDYLVTDDYEYLTPDSFKKIAVSCGREWNEIDDFVKSNNLLLPITKNDYFDVKSMSKNEKEFYTRMLFSCLVDADYTETASFEDPEYKVNSVGFKFDVEDLINKLNDYRNEIIKNSDPHFPLNVLRNQVFMECTEAGKEQKDKLYTLTAPTGTAKTLALFSFALEKARALNKRKIFIVLPYLSIISQNAKIYRDICGEDIVLEDDSLTEYTDETRAYAERWSSSVIVTTSVKFFETLFRAKSTSLRKLHQIANSIVVFDECQTLPSNVLNSTIEIMGTLTKYYHTTVLFSTATLPSYKYRKDIKWEAKEVISDVVKLYDDYEIAKRTRVEYDTENEYDSIALLEKMNKYQQVLFVFNTVKKATDMYQKLVSEYGNNNCYLLSSNLCAQHKLDLIESIKKKLKEGKECFVASTQCIEAGVDLDFPNGAREYAPFDSEIQTAGRVNRNGKREGYILYFRHIDSGLRNYPSTYYRNASEVSFWLAKNSKEDNQLENMDKYFKHLYTSISECERDDEDLLSAISEQDYAKISDKYQLIDDNNQVNIIVPYKGLMDEYNLLSEKIHSMENCITKQMMRNASMFRVTSYKKEDADRNCEKLSLRTSKGCFDTNWYLLTQPELYNEQGIDFRKGDVSLCL